MSESDEFLNFAWKNVGQVTRPAGGVSWFRQAGLEPVTLLVDTLRLGPHSFYPGASYLKTLWLRFMLAKNPLGYF